MGPVGAVATRRGEAKVTAKFEQEIGSMCESNWRPTIGWRGSTGGGFSTAGRWIAAVLFATGLAAAGAHGTRALSEPTNENQQPKEKGKKIQRMYNKYKLASPFPTAKTSCHSPPRQLFYLYARKSDGRFHVFTSFFGWHHPPCFLAATQKSKFHGEQSRQPVRCSFDWNQNLKKNYDEIVIDEWIRQSECLVNDFIASQPRLRLLLFIGLLFISQLSSEIKNAEIPRRRVFNERIGATRREKEESRSSVEHYRSRADTERNARQALKSSPYLPLYLIRFSVFFIASAAGQ